MPRTSKYVFRWRLPGVQGHPRERCCFVPDEMFISPDSKSMRRGRRRSARTETCRPCCLWPIERPGEQTRGVAMDISPYGMRIRTAELLPIGPAYAVQLMRDDDFKEPLSPPVEGVVVRYVSTSRGMTDHGFQLKRVSGSSEKIGLPRAPSKARALRRKTGARSRLADFKASERKKR